MVVRSPQQVACRSTINSNDTQPTPEEDDQNHPPLLLYFLPHHVDLKLFFFKKVQTIAMRSTSFRKI